MISLPLAPRLIMVSPASWTSVMVMVTAWGAEAFIKPSVAVTVML
jgi:hypothetical protein